MTMHPGTETDRLVATRVMGWKEGEEPFEYCYLPSGAPGGWYPSTSIEQAMMVLHRCLLEGKVLAMRGNHNAIEVEIGDGQSGAYVSCDPEDGLDTLPMAICEAALRAYGVSD